MRKILIFVLVITFVIPVFAAVDKEELTFTAIVPEDYGVTIPEDAIMFDKLAINIDGHNEGEYLLTSDLVHLGEISAAEDNTMKFSMLYYGNLANSYDVNIKIDPGVGWYIWRGDEMINFPIDVEYAAPAELDSAVIYNEDDESATVRVSVLPTGPQTALPVVDVKMNWEGIRDLIPGVYQTDLKVKVDIV